MIHSFRAPVWLPGVLAAALYALAAGSAGFAQTADEPPAEPPVPVASAEVPASAPTQDPPVFTATDDGTVLPDGDISVTAEELYLVSTAPVDVDPTKLYRLVKLFDFDERPLGNFEDVPMYWHRLGGDGLPLYSDGRFDDAVGHRAAPSFRFNLCGGNIVYEYAHADLEISPESDYLIEGFVRATGLVHARAFIACFLVDEAGERIADSVHVSQLIRSRSPRNGREEEWQRVDIPLRVEDARARALRVQLWVLQTYVFEEPPANSVDPIVRQDVDAQVWFDDVAIVRVPRATLRFSNPGGLVHPGSGEFIQLTLHNATLADLRAELMIVDDAGVPHKQTNFCLPPLVTEEYSVPVPSLPPGTYDAHVRVTSGDDRLIERALRFAVLPALPAGGTLVPDLGIDLGRFRNRETPGAAELIRGLRCGAVKLGLPIVGTSPDLDQMPYMRQVRDFAQALGADQIEATAVVLPFTSADQSRARTTVSRALRGGPGWDERLGPALAALGNHFAAWQLGSDADEVEEVPAWTGAAVEDVRHRLERFTAIPPFVIPCSALDLAPTAALLETLADAETPLERMPAIPPATPGLLPPGTFTWSVWLPASLPPAALPWHLAFLLSHDEGDEPAAAASSATSWFSLGVERGRNVPKAARLADLAQRVTLAKALGATRVYVPAPFELVPTGGVAHWQPTDEYIALRTLVQFLSGLSAVTALELPGDGLAILFGQGRRQTLVFWTWRGDDAPVFADLYVGPDAKLTRLDGCTVPLEFDGLRAHVPLTNTPAFLTNLNAELLLLQDSFRVAPALLQLHEPEPRPVLTLRNPYDTDLYGTIELTVPSSWNLTPNPIPVHLAPGQTLSQRLEIKLPPRELAVEQPMGTDIRLRSPDNVDLHFDVPIQIGLRNISIDVTAWWQGDDLVIEQSLRNSSNRPVSFETFCQPPHRPQQEGVFLAVLPGELRAQTYVVPSARDLAGARVWLGAQEIGGRRALDQLVAVPQ